MVSVATPRMRMAAEKLDKKIEKSGKSVVTKEKAKASPLSPMVLGLLLFVLVGSSLATTAQFMWQS